MKKNLFFAAMAIALASCTSDDFVGENNNSPNPGNGPEKAIVFGSGTNSTTRATKTGGDAAALLKNNFVFAGTKSDGSTTPSSFVFDQYTAQYVANTAYTTESNSSDWEYVGYTPASVSNVTSQSIKYWDYSTKQYDFAAYSLGESTGVTATAIGAGNKSYTLTGSVDQLMKCYISDLVTAYNHDGVNDYGKIVQFSFRSLGTKIRLAFYETIPGYAVKDVQFYNAATGGTASTTPTLFTSTAALPAGSGTMTITFPTVGWDNSGNATGTTKDADYNKAHVAFTLASGSTASSTLAFDALANYPTTYEGTLTSGNYIGRASNEATYAGGTEGTPAAGKYYNILPKGDGENLQLRIKFTMVSADGSGEEITVDNATAVVPKELAKWNPNFAYTYIFKISDMTNGTTGVDGSGNPVTGLTPITLNAVVVDSEDGLQETITTVSAPSITTYSEGKVVTANNEYKTGAPIYIIVNNGTENVNLSTTGKLYTAVLTPASGKAAQTISEESVANALANGNYDTTAKTYTVQDAHGATLVLTESTLLTASTKIDAADSPTGIDITVTGAKFTPATAGTYVFEYVKTARSAGTYTQVTSGTTLTAGTTYFTSADGKGGFVSDGTQTADASHNYWEETTAPTKGEYFYKIINVQ